VNKAKLLNAAYILIDEATGLSKYALKAIDSYMKEIMQEHMHGD